MKIRRRLHERWSELTPQWNLKAAWNFMSVYREMSISVYMKWVFHATLSFTAVWVSRRSWRQAWDFNPHWKFVPFSCKHLRLQWNVEKQWIWLICACHKKENNRIFRKTKYSGTSLDVHFIKVAPCKHSPDSLCLEISLRLEFTSLSCKRRLSETT